MLRKWFNERISTWLQQQLKIANEHYLTRTNIYILPSRFGIYFLGSSILLFLLGTNYQNNLILMFSFMMLGIMLVTMFHTFMALHGITIKLDALPPMENSNISELSVLIATKRKRQLLKFNFERFLPIRAHVLAKEKVIKIPHRPNKRGVYRLPRMTIETNYPLGLFRCWSYVCFKEEVSVYPKPLRLKSNDFNRLIEACRSGRDENSYNLKNTLKRSEESEEVEQLNQYTKGQPLTRVSWKHVASGQGWYYKSGDENEGHVLTIDERFFNYSSLEERLSAMSFVVSSCFEKGIIFNFVLGNDQVEQVNSVKQLEHCYRLLAAY